MKLRNASRCMLGVVVVALFLAVTWSTMAARSTAISNASSAINSSSVVPTPTKVAAADLFGATARTSSFDQTCSSGTGVVSLTSNDGSCLAYTPPQGNGPGDWEVVEGGSYTMTITGVSECSGPAITVFVQGSLTGNFCFNAVNTIQNPTTYTGRFVMPNPACFTYPISYKCGADQACSNADTFDARGPNDACTVHLRASTFTAGCASHTEDQVCTLVCSINGPTTAACRETGLTFTGPAGVASYSWSFDGDSNGATFCSGTISQSVCVNAGTGDFTLKLTLNENTACTQMVTVTGCPPQECQCTPPADITIECGTSTDPANTGGSATCGTGCQLADPPYTDTTETGDCGSDHIVRVITRMWHCTNGTQVSDCPQIITVEDTTAPTFDNCTDGNTPLGCNPTSIPDADTSITASDTCSTATVTSKVEDSGTDCGGHTRTITYTAEDECHNKATCVKTYTWKVDTEPPALVGVPTGGYLGCNPTPPSCANVTATDNCDGTAEVTCTPGDVIIDGCNRSQTFTYSAQDSCHNPTSVQVTYTWKVDTTLPTIDDPVTVPTIYCPAPTTLPFVQPGASDGCGSVTVYQDGADVTVTAGFTCGTKTVTRSWYALDGCGNRSRTVSQTITIECNNCGGLTMGFWQNKNGQAIITSYGGTALSTWLNGFNPFKDLAAGSSANATATYITNVIKAANASGTTMNAMLKAQMLATALDVYFSDPALGGNRIGAPGPLGAVKIDLTHINKPIGSSTYEDVSAAFGGATCMSVLDMLNYAASQSNSGGSVWYGQVKATQELAKDAFDAINNNKAYSCP